MSNDRDTVFGIIERAAIAGARCPQTQEFPKGTAALIYKLAADGRIRIETYALNYRVIEILDGPHKGKRTAACPHNHDGPWRIMDKAGTHYPRQDSACLLYAG